MTTAVSPLLLAKRPKIMKVVAKAVIYHVGNDLANPILNTDEWRVLVLQRFPDDFRPESPSGQDLPGGVVQKGKKLQRYNIEKYRLVRRVFGETGINLSTHTLRFIDKRLLSNRPGTVSWYGAATTHTNINLLGHASSDWVEMNNLEAANLPDWMAEVIRSGVDVVHRQLTS
jgi:hypothetical protein